MDPDPDPAVLLCSFSQLRSKHSRQAVLHGLVPLLHPDEWRDLRDRLHGRPFNCDVLGSLPVELVAQIAKHLGLSDMVLLQRVSKQWRFLLSSPLVQSMAIHHRCGVALSSAECARSFTRYARRRIMLERGQPVSAVQYHLPRKTSSHAPPIMDYARGRCAWVDMGDDGRCRGIALRDLRSGVLQRFYSENRTPYTGVRVSDTIVAAVSVRGYCHVWNHHNQETASFRLPSMHFDFFLASGPKVVFGFTDCLVAWDFRTHIAHMADVASDLLFMALDSAGDTVTVVHPSHTNTTETSKSIDPTQLRISKYPLDGSTHPSPLTSSSIHIPPVPTPDLVLDTSLLLNTPMSLLTLCNDRIGAVGLRRAQRPAHTDFFLFISHDSDTDRLSLHILNYKYAYTNPIVSVGCNILYYLVLNPHSVHVGVSNPHDLPPFRSSAFMGVDARHAQESPYCSLYGDAEFVLLLHEDGLTAWCFDDAARVPGASPVVPLDGSHAN